jgi:hypothetical protein
MKVERTMLATIDRGSFGPRRSTTPTVRTNEPATISFCCALVLPLAAARAVLAAHAAPPGDSIEASLGVLLGLAAAPAALVAVVTGHQALLRARLLPYAHAGRRLAWSGLVGGYLCMSVILGVRILPSVVSNLQPASAHGVPASTQVMPAPHGIADPHALGVALRP